MQLRMQHSFAVDVSVTTDNSVLVRMLACVKRDGEDFAQVVVIREGEDFYRAYHAIRFRNGDWPQLLPVPPIKRHPVPMTRRQMTAFCRWLYEPYL